MLKNRYNEVIVGLNLPSLIRALISLSRKRTTLLIDDPAFKAETYPGVFLSELEVIALLRLGKRYQIPELMDLRQFLVPASINFVSDKFRLKIGADPLTNLRELLRKFPELLDGSDLDLVFKEDPENFNNFFLEELRRYEALCYEWSLRPKGFRFELQGPAWLRTIFSRWSSLLNTDYSKGQDLRHAAFLHLLGVENEEKLKSRLGPEEIPFYFFRLLSPKYRLQDFFLTTQLKRRLSLSGGDYKESPIQFWQLYRHRFENLLLRSFEGVISGERVLFFSHLPEEVPFTVSSAFPFFRKTQVLPLKRAVSPFPPSRLTVMGETKGLGMDLPFRGMISSDEEVLKYHWPYPERPGSKPEFYREGTWQDFKQDSASLPFKMEDPQFGRDLSVTMDLRGVLENRKSEAPILTRLPVEIVQDETSIQGFEYWGPFRYQGLGFLALCYGVEAV